MGKPKPDCRCLEGKGMTSDGKIVMPLPGTITSLHAQPPKPIKLMFTRTDVTSYSSVPRDTLSVVPVSPMSLKWTPFQMVLRFQPMGRLPPLYVIRWIKQTFLRGGSRRPSRPPEGSSWTSSFYVRSSGRRRPHSSSFALNFDPPPPQKRD